MNSFLSQEELGAVGFKSVGRQVLVSRKASVYKPEAIEIGDYVRVDDFCLLSGGAGINVGNYVHLSAYSALYGGGGIELGDFSGLSPRATIFSESDDFSGHSMIHPFFPIELKPGQLKGLVRLGRFVQVGCNSTLLPDIEVGEGAVIGAHSLVLASCDPWGIYVGVPAIRKQERSNKVVELADEYMKSCEDK